MRYKKLTNEYLKFRILLKCRDQNTLDTIGELFGVPLQVLESQVKSGSV